MTNILLRLTGLLAAIAGLVCSLAAAPTHAPVTPDAIPEAKALLELLYDLSGQHTLTGQHNYPNIRDRNTQFAVKYTGRMPAVFSSDLGHAKAGDTDSYLARPDIVDECIRQHRAGSLVTLCWHAVPPTADEPVTFSQLPGSDPKALKSVQGKLLDEQFKELLTPGTALHTKWESQVDAIAVFLKQLQDAKVPVLWRPYHEMNGDWFWWGGRGADTATLYRQIFDRLVKHHGLKNLIWVWSMDRASRKGMEHEKYFPGIEYVDVLGLDVYGNDFAQSYYESLERLSQGKPLTLAEVGNPPSLEIMAKQPKWTFYVTWAGMVRNATRHTYQTLFSQGPFVNRDDPRYAQLTAKYRAQCGLPTLETSLAPTYSGRWFLNEEQSDFGRLGAAGVPVALDVTQRGDDLTIRATQIQEYTDDRVREEKLVIGGGETRSELMRGSRQTTLKRGEHGELVFDSIVAAPAGGAAGGKMAVKDVWTLSGDGGQLVIVSEATTPAGVQKTRFVFDRR